MATKQHRQIAYDGIEASTISGRHYNTIYDAIKGGRLRAYRRQGASRYTIFRDDLLAWMRGEEPGDKVA